MREKQVPSVLDILPVLEELRGKIIVAKIGGSVLKSEDALRRFAQDIVALKALGAKPIVVHGGGPEINQMLEKVGIEVKFKNGLRITDAPTMEIVLMVLAGKANKTLVKVMNEYGANAVGVSGVDANLSNGVKDMTFGDIGYVGKIVKVNVSFVLDLLSKDYTIVVATVGTGEDGFYNINADVAAACLAKALQAEKLIILTDVDGVIVNGEVIRHLTVSESQKLIESGVAKDGMLPKLVGVIDAVRDGVKTVHIINGKIDHSILIELFGKETIGTVIEEG